MALEFSSQPGSVSIGLNDLTAVLEKEAVDALTHILETVGTPGEIEIPTLEPSARLMISRDKTHAKISLSAQVQSELKIFSNESTRDKVLRSLRVVTKQAFGIPTYTMDPN